VMSVLGSIGSTVSWPSDNILAWVYARLPVLGFALAAVLFYTKVFCDDLRSHAKDGGMLSYSCMGWIAFIVQMTTIRNLTVTVVFFMAGILTLTFGIWKNKGCTAYAGQNIVCCIFAFVLLVSSEPWSQVIALFWVGYSVAVLFFNGRN